MKAEELRLGNKATAYGKEIEISASDFAVLAMYGAKNENHPYSPIPLTEEWLLKLGAEENEGCFIHDRFKLQHHDVYKFWYVFDVTLMAYITKVEFVHEWQNVYFALNGEELTVK